MSDHVEHTNQAEHNEAVLSYFESQSKEVEFGDWYVTIAFYSAIHRIEAMLDIIKPRISVGGVKTEVVEHSCNKALRMFYNTQSEHDVRNRLIKARFGRMFVPFYALYAKSRDARYNCQELEPNAWLTAKDNLQYVKDHCGYFMENVKK